MKNKALTHPERLLAANILLLLHISFLCSCGKDVMVKDGREFGYFQLVQSAGCRILPLGEPHIAQAASDGQIIRISQKDYLTCKSTENVKDAVEKAAEEARDAVEEANERAEER